MFFLLAHTIFYYNHHETLLTNIRMPASSAIDLKDRIMGGGINAVARRKGSVHRLAESWDVGDYGKKDSDYR